MSHIPFDIPTAIFYRLLKDLKLVEKRKRRVLKGQFIRWQEYVRIPQAGYLVLTARGPEEACDLSYDTSRPLNESQDSLVFVMKIGRKMIISITNENINLRTKRAEIMALVCTRAHQFAACR